MMTFKDLFSGHASDYKQFRPTYPPALFQFIADKAPQHQAVWDCATGNGQGAIGLASYFQQVYATDASTAQISQAQTFNNINYSVATAEDCQLPSNSVSAVTVFQALHWFNLPQFYEEVKRVLIADGLLVIIGYNTAITGIKTVDDAYQAFCFDYLWKKNCWEMERHTLNSNYQQIDFPFKEIKSPKFSANMQWSYQDYINYLNTWSAVKTHIKLYNENPVDSFMIPKIKTQWPNPDKPRPVRFPLIVRSGLHLKHPSL